VFSDFVYQSLVLELDCMRTQLDSLREWSSQMVSVIGHSDADLERCIDDLTAEWNQLNTQCQAEIRSVEGIFNQVTVFRDRLSVSVVMKKPTS
jgi:hypothetical protein